MTPIDPDKIAHELSERGLDWADKDAAYRALDELTKTVLAEIKLAFDDKSDAAREMKALASKAYREHLASVSAARGEANRAKAKLKTYETWIELKRSIMATERAQMELR